MTSLALALALSTPAQADPADAPLACAVASFANSMPQDGETNLPVDLSPVLTFIGNCAIPAPYTVSLFREGETVPVRTDVFDAEAFSLAGDTALLELDLGGLDPDTAYTLEASGEFDQNPVVIGFETGSDTVAPFDGAAPDVTVNGVFSDRLAGGVIGIRVDLTLTSASETPEQSTYVIRSGGFDREIVLASGATQQFDLSYVESERPDEVCVTVVERDGAGTWHGPSDTQCAPVPRPVGCSVTGSPATGFGLLAGLLALPFLRRRGL